MATTAQSVAEVSARAKAASRELATLDTATKNAALEAMADALEQRSHEILEANARDMEAGEDAGLQSGLLDRLKLTEERLAGIAADVRTIAALPDPVGETIEGHRLENRAGAGGGERGGAPAEGGGGGGGGGPRRGGGGGGGGGGGQRVQPPPPPFAGGGGT